MHTRLRPSGGYRRTAAFQTATIVYDATWWFCERFLDKRSRTVDQMIQAARSGRQNIAEGSRASATSSQTELRLMNVARASLEELLLDYEDFLRHRRLTLWEPDGPQARAVRDIGRASPGAESAPSPASLFGQYARWLESDAPDIRANAIICLIHQANFLIDRQIASLEQAFVKDGGYSEQLAMARLRKRSSSESAETAVPSPKCPDCGSTTVLRTAKKGRNAGSSFWGCTGYPKCSGAVAV